MDRRRPRSALALAAAIASVALSLPVSHVTACSGATVSFEQIRTGADRIVIGTVIDVDATEDVSERILLRVEAVLRGVSGPEVVLEPPTFMGCGGRMDEPVGARLVVATGPHYFSASPPEELHPYWRVLPGDVVEPAGVDDPDPDHSRLDGLLAAFGGRAAATVEPEAIVEPVPPPDQIAIVAVAIVVATLLAAAAVFTGAWSLARRHR